MARLIKSFFHAFRGLWFAFRHEKNLQIHAIVTLLVITVGLILKLSVFEFIILIAAIIFVFVAELLNTIVELIIDYINPHFNQRARIIKDLSAGTVLIVALGAIIIGFLIFYPHLLILIKR
jgi:diacylglycerol kinase